MCAQWLSFDVLTRASILMDTVVPKYEHSHAHAHTHTHKCTHMRSVAHKRSHSTKAVLDPSSVQFATDMLAQNDFSLMADAMHGNDTLIHV